MRPSPPQTRQDSAFTLASYVKSTAAAIFTATSGYMPKSRFPLRSCTYRGPPESPDAQGNDRPAPAILSRRTGRSRHQPTSTNCNYSSFFTEQKIRITCRSCRRSFVAIVKTVATNPERAVVASR